MAPAGKRTHLWIKAGFRRTLSHKYTFRSSEQHLTWRLPRSRIGEHKDSPLGTKEPHPAHHPSRKGGRWRWPLVRRDPGLAFISRDREVHSQSCSGRKLDWRGSPPTAQVLLFYLIFIKSEPDGWLKGERGGKDVVITWSPWLSKSKKWEKANLREAARGRQLMSFHQSPTKSRLLRGVWNGNWHLAVWLSPVPHPPLHRQLMFLRCASRDTMHTEENICMSVCVHMYPSFKCRLLSFRSII